MSSKTGSYIPPNQYPQETGIESDQNNLQEKIANLQYGLKSSPKHISCPFCKKQGMTKVEQSCSVAAGVLCTVGLFLLPMCIQLCRRKDLNCTDADHYCISCGNKLASYKTC